LEVIVSELLQKAVEEIDKIVEAEGPGRVISAKNISLKEILESDPSYLEILDGAVCVYWGGYSYEISLDDIPSPLRLAGWVMHLSEKSWPLMTPERIGTFMYLVCKEKGWDPHTGDLGS
jgi:hypothetical protein